jgi:hypothetical protein
VNSEQRTENRGGEQGTEIRERPVAFGGGGAENKKCNRVSGRAIAGS